MTHRNRFALEDVVGSDLVRYPEDEFQLADRDLESLPSLPPPLPPQEELVSYTTLTERDLRESAYPNGRLVGAVLQVTDIAGNAYQLTLLRFNDPQQITVRSENDMNHEGLEALSFALRAFTGGTFYVDPQQGGIRQDSKGIHTTLYLVDSKGCEDSFDDIMVVGKDVRKNDPHRGLYLAIATQEDRTASASDLNRWLEQRQYWNPAPASRERPQRIPTKGLFRVGPTTPARMYNPSAIAVSQNNIVQVMGYLRKNGYTCELREVGYLLQPGDREKSSFAEDLKFSESTRSPN